MPTALACPPNCDSTWRGLWGQHSSPTLWGWPVNPEAFDSSQEAEITSDHRWRKWLWGRRRVLCPAGLERQAGTLLSPLAGCPVLNRRKVFPWSISQPLVLEAGLGGLWPNLVHNRGDSHPPGALGFLSFTKFMDLLTHPVLLCGSSLFRSLSTN